LHLRGRLATCSVRKRLIALVDELERAVVPVSQDKV
jgi:hypothetical protein